MTKFLTTAALALAVTGAALPAMAIDVGPADYTLMPGGTKMGLLYLQHLSSDRFILNGAEVPGSKFSANVAILRGLNYTTIGDETVLLQFVLPVSDISTAQIGGGALPVEEGLGDLTLGITYWPVKPANPETGTTIGLTAFLTAPTGAYEMGSVGIGEGTWTLTPQIGLIQGLGNGFYLDAVADVALSLDHTENGVEVSRDPAWQVQAMLRKQFSPETNFALGLSGQFGGDLTVGGVGTGQKIRRDQIRLYGSTFIGEGLQIQGMLARDLHVEGGFEYSTVAQVRLLKVF
ncbi:transporter [Pseudogemmobacter humi]|uniref:MetA-pathway of phenol degradation n=1 Tax=Pseudogemmobacter humi TaxID=2483812 RepID=A0A3P5XL49_9RHOB|nr:transporter [Pseudogemmobacter humi]VDC29362.1 hypothetical protein XINFAN_02308 [Pseudogemmobacter humi]